MRMGEVAVWWQQAGAAEADADWALLDADERERADRFVSPLHRTRFIRSHGLLRRVLSRCTGQPASALRFRTGPHGKPELEDGPAREDGDDRLAFNLSHSGDLAVVAVSRGASVGVDVEEMRPLDDRDALVERFFSPAEVTAFAKMAAAERHLAFYRLWTRKEAYVKGLGTGLSLDLATFSVSAGARAGLLDLAGTDWRLTDLSLGPGVAAALAVHHPHPSVSLQCGIDA